ncbi:acyl-CoA N-acyltransferase [Mariannaea sp. PMI_226]|nr:acyl-CoA N-acyltransferase [Mariannaea sp. PMI_226]
MAPINIRPPTIDDQDAIFRVHYAALEAFHDFYGAFLKLNPQEAMRMAIKRALESREDTFLLAEQDDTVVGFVRYSVVKPSSPEVVKPEAEAKETQSAAPAPSLFQPKEHLKDLWARFGTRQDEMDACKDKALNGEGHIYIQHLMVHPDHQRKGVGRQLLQRVIDQADANGVPTYLVSSAEAHRLYASMGFSDLGTWPIDNGYWAREIVRESRDAGAEVDEDLVRKFDGVKEVEECMIRRRVE